VTVNDLAGPFSSWWFFSGGSSDPNYIHCVIRTAADRYTHFSFGQIDQKSMTHAVCSYVTGLSSVHWQDTSNQGYNPPAANHPSQQAVPFASSGVVVYSPDAFPSSGSWSAGMATSYAGVGYQNCEFMKTVKLRDSQAATFSAANPECRLLDSLGFAYASSYSGYAPFYALPVLIRNNANGNLVYLGDFPNVRLINMQDISVETEIALGADTWKVFPIMRYDSFSNVGSTPCVPQTGPYGIAYKKNV
jgi:hypothetical protein